MGKCVICGEDVGERAKTCSGKCRKTLSRRQGVTKGVTDVTLQAKNVTLKQGVTYPDTCQYCGCDIPKLLKPRKYPGSCYPCAIAQPAPAYGEQWPEYRYAYKEPLIMA